MNRTTKAGMKMMKIGMAVTFSVFFALILAAVIIAATSH
jgi:hypothetical protein